MVLLPTSARQRSLAQTGVVLWVLGCLIGTFFLTWMFLIVPLFSKQPGALLLAEVIAFAFALPACLVYVWVPMIIDRYDPEPWWALLMTFLWGALAAAGFAGFINSFLGFVGGAMGGELGEAVIGSVFSAPFIEEAFKGAAVLGLFLFLRREFDGVVDGVIYATYSALGFAMTENVLYYSQGLVSPAQGAFGFQLLFRGILEPWGHPLYTAMFGLGVGVARESPKGWLRWGGPLIGYLGAVGLHALWNGTAVLSHLFHVPLVLLLLVVYFFLMLLFLGILVALVVREGRILRRHLEEHVAMKHITRDQLNLICSPVGRLSAMLRYGRAGRELVKVGTRLGMAKWHAARAMRDNQSTMSIAAVVPLTEEMMRLAGSLQPRPA